MIFNQNCPEVFKILKSYNIMSNGFHVGKPVNILFWERTKGVAKFLPPLSGSLTRQYKYHSIWVKCPILVILEVSYSCHSSVQERCLPLSTTDEPRFPQKLFQKSPRPSVKVSWNDPSGEEKTKEIQSRIKVLCSDYVEHILQLHKMKQQFQQRALLVQLADQHL